MNKISIQKKREKNSPCTSLSVRVHLSQVALQRPLFAAVRVGQVATMGIGAAATSDAQADGFYNAAYFTTALYFAAAEWAARDPLAAEELGAPGAAVTPGPRGEKSGMEGLAAEEEQGKAT